ncbi:MAG TPA: purine nucleoside permease [Opitutaceae bacterium]|jgi:purine nucleoside permease|nr:purine nucleoside permease [Opitutaceae bacterium]
MKRRLVLCITLFFCSFAARATAEPIKVKVVVVAMFEMGQDTGDAPGEFQFWVEREKLERTWSFPQGERDLRSTSDGSVLGVVTGVGTIHSSATIMALGLDPRFDLSHAYWVVAGIAGANPNVMSIGSAAWAHWVVDGDLGHEIDAREMPAGWTTGHIPLRMKAPYEAPMSASEGQVFRLNPVLVDWAYNLTKDTVLTDTPGLQKHRALYVGYPKALEAPSVIEGDNLASMNYWHGALMNTWAEGWVKYFTAGQGTFATSAMEDTGTVQALTWLTRAGKADVSRVLVLRTASNYVMQWPGATAAQSLSGESLDKGYSAYIPSLEAAYKVGSRVVHELSNGWAVYELTPPK